MLVPPAKSSRLLILTRFLLFAILALAVTFLSSGCRHQPEFKLPALQILPTGPAILDLNIAEVGDSLRMQVQGFNEITGRLALDTVITEGDHHWQWPIPLEVAKMVGLSLNGSYRFFLMIPGETTVVHIGKTTEAGYSISGFGGITAEPNYYYQQRDSLLQTYDLRVLYSALAVIDDLQECFKAIDSVGELRQKHLQEAYAQNSIPGWFYEYENANIRYDNYIRKAGSISYREFMLGKERERAVRDTLSIPWPIEDPTTLAHEQYWSFLQGWSLFAFCDESCYGEGPKYETRAWARIRALQSLQNKQIQQTAFALEYALLNRSSFVYSDSLMRALRSGLEEKPQYINYLDSLSVPTLVNQAVPLFYLKDEKENFTTPADFSDKVRLISFWFVGCTPCYREFPHEDRLVKEFADQPFELISICVNSSEEAWRTVLDKQQLRGTQLFANENWSKKLMKNYRIGGFPHLVLVDQSGIVADERAPRPSDPVLEENIRKLLDGNGE